MAHNDFEFTLFITSCDELLLILNISEETQERGRWEFLLQLKAEGSLGSQELEPEGSEPGRGLGGSGAGGNGAWGQRQVVLSPEKA